MHLVGGKDGLERQEVQFLKRCCQCNRDPPITELSAAFQDYVSDMPVEILPNRANLHLEHRRAKSTTDRI